MAIFTHVQVHAADRLSLEDSFYRQNGYTTFPVVIQCFLTLRCPLSCPHCLAFGNGKAMMDMPLALFERLCREAAAGGVDELLLTGGEPLCRDDWEVIIDIMAAAGLSWSLNTALCPDARQKDAIRRYPPTYVAVSLDGPQELHNRFRNRTGAFDEAMASLHFFGEIPSTRTCAGTTVTQQNLPFFDQNKSKIA